MAGACEAGHPSSPLGRGRQAPSLAREPIATVEAVVSRMKISITYLYTIFRFGYPHRFQDTLQSILEIRDLGFRYLELEGLGRAHLRQLDRNRETLRNVLNDCGVHVHNFCVVDTDLVALNAEKRSRAFDNFKRGAELAEFLEAETVHLASYTAPVHYLDGRPYALGLGDGYHFADNVHLRIPRGFSWERVWNTLVSSCQFCADVAAQHGRTVIMEPRVGEIISSVDSLLRLLEHVDRPNFKANFDTAHFSAQRQNIPLALAMLEGQFANVHVADNNPTDTEHLPVGEGIIDWNEFFRLLKRMNYKGYLGLDLGTKRPLVAGYRASVEKIQEIASELDLEIEV